MFRAFVVKGVTALAMLAWLTALGWPRAALPMALTFIAMCAFFTYCIAHPAAQFFVPSVTHLPAGTRGVALTFDDGPDPTFTPRVLELLDAYDAKATFFVVGERAAAHPELVRDIARRGHTLGSHSQTHALSFHGAGVAHARAEVRAGMQSIARITGVRPRLFRPPQGVRTPFLRDALRGLAPDEAVTCVTWTARGLDATSKSSDAIIARLAPHLREGAILVLHDGTGLHGTNDRTPTLIALEHLLSAARSRGLPCVPLASLEPAP